MNSLQVSQSIKSAWSSSRASNWARRSNMSSSSSNKSSASKSYDEFIEDLPPSEPRYAVYDFEYQKGDEGIRNKLCFFSWTPDESKIKQKMLYASSKDALRKSLVGISTEIQGTDLSEVAYDTVLDRVSRGTS